MNDLFFVIGLRMETRAGSLYSLIENLREPSFVRRCLWRENKRLLIQVITGKMAKY